MYLAKIFNVDGCGVVPVVYGTPPQCVGYSRQDILKGIHKSECVFVMKIVECMSYTLYFNDNGTVTEVDIFTLNMAYALRQRYYRIKSAEYERNAQSFKF